MNLRKTLEHVDEPLEQRNQEYSLRLAEGAQVELDDPGAKADASAASETFEDVGKKPKRLLEASKRVRKRSERKSQNNSPGRPGEEPEDPSGDAVVPGGTHGVQEHPRSIRNERVDGTNSPCRDRAPRGCRSDQVESRGVEGVQDRENVVDRAGYDGKHPRIEDNERDGGTDARTRETGPGGQLGERGGPGDVEGDRERQSDGDGVETDRRRDCKDGETSGARCDSKRVETTLLAEGETGQYRRRTHTTTDVPEPSTPPTIDPRRPTDHPNPPRHHGRLKTRPRSISTRIRTYQVVWTCRGHIGRIGPFRDVVYRLEMVEERSGGAKRADESTGVDRDRLHALGQRDH